MQVPGARSSPPARVPALHLPGRLCMYVSVRFLPRRPEDVSEAGLPLGALACLTLPGVPEHKSSLSAPVSQLEPSIP